MARTTASRGKPAEKIGKTETIVRYLQNMILNENPNPREALPSFQQLGYQFDVSRVTIEKALARVAELGLIRREKGRGIYPLPPEERSGPIDVFFGMSHLAITEGAFFWEIFKGITAGAVSVSRDTRMLSSLVSKNSIDELPAIMANRSVFGLVAFGTYDDGFFLKLRDLGWPTVALDFDASTLGLDCVVNDSAADARSLTQMLLERGCKRPVYVMPEPGGDGKQRDPDDVYRHDGFIQALEEAGVDTSEAVYRGKSNKDALRDFVERVKPDGVLGDFTVTSNAGWATTDLGLDCHFAVFNGTTYRPFPDYMNDAICTNYDFMEMGRKGVELLLNRLKTGRGRVERAVIPMRVSNNEDERRKILFGG